MMEIAISPCPNDTYLFSGMQNVQLVMADIQQLNLWALDAKYPITKISAVCFAKVTHEYALLPVGAAIGPFGPKLIAKSPFDLRDLGTKRVAVPGKDTTASLLFSTLLPKPREVHFCRYDEVAHLIAAGKVDAGVIIHETRFTFRQMGFSELADLGVLFHERFGLPVPLGVVVAKNSLPQHVVEEVVLAMRTSLKNAEINDFVLAASQEKDPAIVKEHIKTYVTKETEEISDEGMRAIRALFTLGVDHSLLPKDAAKF